MTKRLIIPPKPGADQWVTQGEETPARPHRPRRSR